MFDSPNGPPLSPEDSEEIEALARAFFDAIRDDDGQRLWELFSEEARAYVLNRAIEGGLDFDLGSRLRQGTASQEEWGDYLSNLVAGIHHDLRGVDLDALRFELRREPEVASTIRVTYLVTVGARSGGEHAIPAGALLTVHEEGRWRVLRLIPRPA